MYGEKRGVAVGLKIQGWESGGQERSHGKLAEGAQVWGRRYKYMGHRDAKMVLGTLTNRRSAPCPLPRALNVKLLKNDTVPRRESTSASPRHEAFPPAHACKTQA